jgi:uncharacterized membrane protein YraQ (UPF0718 family)
MLVKAALNHLKTALVENRRSLLWVIATYIPAVFAAGYLGSWLFHTYVLAFVVGGGYMLALMAIWLRVLMAVRDRG